MELINGMYYRCKVESDSDWKIGYHNDGLIQGYNFFGEAKLFFEVDILNPINPKPQILLCKYCDSKNVKIIVGDITRGTATCSDCNTTFAINPQWNNT